MGAGLTGTQGRIQIVGQSFNSVGVRIEDSTIVSTSGAITVIGTSGNGTTGAKHGVAVINSDITTGGAQDVTLTGTLGNNGGQTTGNAGVSIALGSTARQIASSGGNVTILGTAGNGPGPSLGVNLVGNGGLVLAIGTTGSGNVSITGLAGAGNSSSTTGSNGVRLQGRVIATVVDGDIDHRGDGECRIDEHRESRGSQ